MEGLRAQEAIKAAYRHVWIKYRTDDELEVRTQNHRRLAGILEGICRSFGRPISVLDAGCGTGRFFHCIKKARTLVGVDLSPEMLRAAKTPVRWQQVETESVELICANIHTISFAPRRFDFIYSLGMFGYGCPVTVELCNRFFEWMAPDGVLFFNIVDFASLTRRTRLRRKLRAALGACFPAIEERLSRRRGKVPFCGLKYAQLDHLLGATQFQDYTLASTLSCSPLGEGRHLECLARKNAA